MLLHLPHQTFAFLIGLRETRDEVLGEGSCPLPFRRNANDAALQNDLCSFSVTVAAAVHDRCNGGRRGGGGSSKTSSRVQESDASGSAAATQGTKQRRGPVVLYDHGYIASPNYPGKYFLDTDCRWRLTVQRRQSIKIILYDFELDVKRAGLCHEYLQISALDGSQQAPRGAVMTEVGGDSADGRIYFRDCGSLGKQTLSIDASEVMVRFKTGQASLAQRGFLLYFEGAKTKQ